jgi:hypothetical protein
MINPHWLPDFSAYNHDIHVMDMKALIEDIQKGVRDKTLSEAEYAELMSDVEAMKKIIELKNDLELNEKIHDAVVALIELAKLVKF